MGLEFSLSRSRYLYSRSYPYANLFEHNTIDFIMADPSHGDNGPYNTFFRNRYPSKSTICIFNSSYTNVIGNVNVSEVITDPSWLVEIGYSLWGYDVKESTHTFDRYFNYYPEGPDWDWGWSSITHGLWWSIFQPDAFYFNVMFPRSFLNDVSYYYDGRPEFISAQYYTWPSNGPSTNLDRDNTIEPTGWLIPAEDRWGESIKTYINPTDWPDKTYISGQFSRDIKLPSSLVHDVQVIDDLVILSGATLTIEPGINLFFNSNTGLTVYGTLDAQGTINAPIFFTSSQSSPSPGDWYGIVVEDGGEIELNHAKVEYATYGVKSSYADV